MVSPRKPQNPTNPEESQIRMDQEVELDGYKFDGVTFVRVILVYRGGQPPSMTNCQFEDCQFDFRDAAGNTLAFITAMYHGGFKPFVEGTIQNIRGNRMVAVKPSPSGSGSGSGKAH